ncbi:MAG TPA: acyltransferase [Puia sp.]|nr:acyltransferase [Puia sp.]
MRRFLSRWKKNRRLGKLLKAGITIPENTRVADNARLDTPYGGKIRVGRECEILDGVLILTYGGEIAIGDRCSINPYAIIYGHGGVTIGNDVLIAGGCMIIPNNHTFSALDQTIREQGCNARGIRIEDDVWIGHGCSILDGVTISKGSVIAAGSVVNKDTKPYSINAGVPARFIKFRNE